MRGERYGKFESGWGRRRRKEMSCKGPEYIDCDECGTHHSWADDCPIVLGEPDIIPKKPLCTGCASLRTENSDMRNAVIEASDDIYKLALRCGNIDMEQALISVKNQMLRRVFGREEV